MGIESKWLGQRQPPTGPRGAQQTQAVFAVSLESTVNAPVGPQPVTQLDITLDDIKPSTQILAEALVGGSVSAAGITPLVRLQVEEFDSAGNSLGLIGLDNSTMQAENASAAADPHQLSTKGLYTRQDPLAVTAKFQVVVAALGGGTWDLVPGSNGGGVHVVTRLTD